ncbi:MAG: ankyrin repeat domain-containing protein [Alphaproteobacteria bacterium]|nr:ankyrin repeat domain-containing protein [Alphaproteobacteria bacterium]
MERTFWIQGRTGRYWQNLESLESDQTAIIRLGALISQDRYDELRLVQAQVSTITGDTTYTNIVTVRDGQVVDSPMLRAQASGIAPDLSEDEQNNTNRDYGSEIAAVQADIDDDDFDPAHHPQLRFWPTQKPEHLQGRLGLGGENRWVGDTDQFQDSNAQPEQAEVARHLQDTPPPKEQDNANAQRSPRRTAKFVPNMTVRSGASAAAQPTNSTGPGDDLDTIREWILPQDLNEDEAAIVGDYDPRVASMQDIPPPIKKAPQNARADAPAPQQPQASANNTTGHLAADPDGRGPDAEPRPDRFRLFGRGKSTRRTSNRQAPSSHRPMSDTLVARKTDSPTGRVALMSGVFAGALATGLALSAINPDFAGRVFASISGQVGEMLPRTSLIDAIANGDLPTVRARLAEGVDPNSLDSEGSPALLRAARAGNLAAVSLLLQAGADPTLPTQDGRSVLHRIAAEGRGQALQRMIDAGAPVDLAGGVYGCLTPLSVAAANGRVRAATLLAERGASFEEQRGCSVGPMEIAAAHPHVLARLEQMRAERDALLQMAGANAKSDTQLRPGMAVITAENESQAAEAKTNTPQTEPNVTSVPEVLDHAQLSALEPPPELESAVDTFTAPPADGSVFLPPSKPAPNVTKPEPTQTASASTLNPRVFKSRLKTAIDSADKGTVVALLGSPPPGFTLDEAKFAVEDGFGSGVRTALEQAALHGQTDIVKLLADDGASIPPRLIHRIVQHSDRPELAGMLSTLLEEGADPNGMSDGLTPLMRASLKGDPQTAYVLMAFGADPAIVSTDGRLASDFARESGRADLEERLVLAAGEPQYRKLMMGLSWSDTLSSLRDKIDVCKDIGDDFTACKLNITSWLSDAKVVVAQFDRKTSNRLVALQIDSRPFSTPENAMDRFEAARRAIQERIPASHAGFLTTEVSTKIGLFQSLRPEVNQARFFSYWPDQDRRRPVFVHLKLTGLDNSHGFYRIVIGNPFRAS